MKKILRFAGVGLLAATAALAQPRYDRFTGPNNDARPQVRSYGSEGRSYQYNPAYEEPRDRDQGWYREGDRDRYQNNEFRYGNGFRDYRYDDERYRVERERPLHHSAAIVGGGAALGAVIGGLAGNGKGAAIGALSGGAAGLLIDRLTHNDGYRH